MPGKENGRRRRRGGEGRRQGARVVGATSALRAARRRGILLFSLGTISPLCLLYRQASQRYLDSVQGAVFVLRPAVGRAPSFEEPRALCWTPASAAPLPEGTRPGCTRSSDTPQCAPFLSSPRCCSSSPPQPPRWLGGATAALTAGPGATGPTVAAPTATAPGPAHTAAAPTAATTTSPTVRPASLLFRRPVGRSCGHLVVLNAAPSTSLGLQLSPLHAHAPCRMPAPLPQCPRRSTPHPTMPAEEKT